MDDVKIGEILLPGEPDRQEERERVIRAKFWPKLKRVMTRVPFARDAAAAYYCAVDRETPLKAKGIILAALAYFVMPMDAVPDVLAVIGFTDDIAVVTAALAMIRAHIKMQHYDAADAMLKRQQEAE
ncbi:YkvA family protein [Agrobacterium tumefaciens]|uniref:YkvA family protein n=1 Tax=Agrobacterium tumefaciens TaxID=358 RepID=UPI00287CAD77|nr:YkvA family protein [Agrobacterium tumefaciens]MDS7598098.1 YkvA family protein [Agrobacterium tumefaciens]